MSGIYWYMLSCTLFPKTIIMNENGAATLKKCYEKLIMCASTEAKGNERLTPTQWKYIPIQR